MAEIPQSRREPGDVLVHVVRLRPVERRDEADAEAHPACESSPAYRSAVSGSTAAPRTRSSKWRWGPVALPVAPTTPTR